MANINWRTINIDALDPESSSNFDTSSLAGGPDAVTGPTSASEVQQLAGQVRQLLQGGDAEGALRGALENAPYAGDGAAKEAHLTTVVEVLQSIKQAEMSPILGKIYGSEGGTETLDVLMKYLYKGMAACQPVPKTNTLMDMGQRTGSKSNEGGQAMSVLLSWHEKLVEIAGQGSIVRVMADRRTV